MVPILSLAETALNLAVAALEKSVLSLLHNWPYLLAGILVTALLKRYIDAGKIAGFLRRHRGAGVVAATGVAVATPLCSCGTTAIVLGMMAGSMPWAPIVAFMAASPLTSPEGLFYSAGLFGWPFAVAYFLASIFLGLAGGAAAAVAEKRGWLANQARLASPVSTPAASPQTQPVCACAEPVSLAVPLTLAPACACAEPVSRAIPLTLVPSPVSACVCAVPAVPAASAAPGRSTDHKHSPCHCQHKVSTSTCLSISHCEQGVLCL